MSAVLYLTSTLAAVTFYLSVKLQSATSWRFLFPNTRALLADYAVTIAVVASTFCSYSISIAVDIVLRIELPKQLGPSCEVESTLADTAFGEGKGIGSLCLPSRLLGRSTTDSAIDTASSSSDLDLAAVTLSTSPTPLASQPIRPLHRRDYTMARAFIASIPISFFFFFDQNISTLFCQRAPGGLGRGKYQHSAFVALGILNLFGPLCGLPFLTGSLPHSPQFVRALTVRNSRTSEVEVAESRIAPLLVYILIGIPLLAPNLILAIPGATIDGVLLFVGYEGIVGTALYQRTLMIFTPKYEFAQQYKGLRKRKISLFTAIQLVLFGLCWMINLSPAGLAVAFLIVSLVPLRERQFPTFFFENELQKLDNKELSFGCDGGGDEDGMEPAFVPRAMVTGVTPAAPPDVAVRVRRHTRDGVYENGGDAATEAVELEARDETTEVNSAKEVVEEAPTTTSLNDVEAGGWQ